MPSLRAQNDYQLYGYIPTEWVCIVFLVFFGLSTAVHLAQAIWYKLPWLLITIVVAGFLEILGWAGRLWNSISPRILDAYLMQICCLILGPAFFMAAMYLTLGLVINRLGPQYSRISPRWYTIIFCTGDLISLIVQAVGGAMAALAVQSRRIPPPDPNFGAKVMVGGIVFQMAVMVAFTALGAEFIVRWAARRPFARRAAALEQNPPFAFGEGEKLDGTTPHLAGEERSEHRRWKLLLVGVALATLLVFIRSVYRTIELLDGWTGTIIREQPLFNLLDGMMIVLALITINFIHPGPLLNTRNRSISLGMKRKRKAKRGAFADDSSPATL